MTAVVAQEAVSDIAQTPNPEDTDSEEPTDLHIVMQCAIKGYVDRLVRCFDDEEDAYHAVVEELLNKRDEEGKSPLDMAALLGRVEMVKELVTRGAEVNSITETGYSALHRAAAWGKIDCVKALVESGTDLQQKTAPGERAREIAVRYNQAECVDYLDWAEAKQSLEQTITTAKETVSDPEKVLGRLTRDDKTTTVNFCTEKLTWLESTPDATTQDFISQKQILDEALAFVWLKLSEPPPEKESKK